jgi:hypothetical protein
MHRFKASNSLDLHHVQLYNPVKVPRQAGCAICEYQLGSSIGTKNRTNLRDVTRRTNASEGNAEAQEEATGQKHSPVDRRGLNTGTDNDDDSACKHACPTSPVIIHRTGEEDSWYGSDIVDRKRDTGAAASRFPVGVSTSSWIRPHVQ